MRCHETEHTNRMRQKNDNPEWMRFSEAIKRSQETETEALLHELLADAKRERDELLAALIGLYECARHANIPDNHYHLVTAAAAVIAKAEGK